MSAATPQSAMPTEPPPAGFVRGNARLERLLAHPVRAVQVAAIRTRMGEVDAAAHLAGEEPHGDDQGAG